MEGPGEGDFGRVANAVPVFGSAGAGKRRGGGGFAFGDGFDAGGVAFAELIGFAGNAEEGSGGLFAGHGGGRLFEREGGFDPVAGVDDRSVNGGCQ